jgi:predicted SAM-dependent methyltransferase
MLNSAKKLHLGCGDNNFSDWLNIDLDTPTADLNLDFTNPLPFADCQITHIFSEHFIEHITRPQAVSFLKECYRTLAEGGVIRITTPSLAFLTAAYRSANKTEWGNLWQPATLCQMVNEGMRSWGHQFLYDGDELAAIFVEAGFRDIVFRNYRESEDPELVDRETRPFHNELIIEARKCSSETLSICSVSLAATEERWIASLQDYVEQATQESGEVILEHRLTMAGAGAERRIATLQQTISEQAGRLLAGESESAARADHIVKLEHGLAQQAERLREVQAESASRAEQLLVLEATLFRQEEAASARDRELTEMRETLAAMVQTITEQKALISHQDEQLLKFRNSLYGKTLSGASKLYSLIQKK